MLLQVLNGSSSSAWIYTRNQMPQNLGQPPHGRRGHSCTIAVCLLWVGLEGTGNQQSATGVGNLLIHQRCTGDGCHAEATGTC
jgi:hypothetical protein